MTLKDIYIMRNYLLTGVVIVALLAVALVFVNPSDTTETSSINKIVSGTTQYD